VSELRFLFAVHNHQPVGNFEHIIDQAFNDCYRPFLERLEKHPGFKFSLHFSGPLWEHMERRERASWDLVKVMAGRGQVELLGGGFYEPILSVIPEEDRLGQIRMMSDFIAANFGQRPRGLWLTERVWEPHLAKTLADSGIEYTLLDEEHFHYAGIRGLHASYITEDEGRSLRIFPIDKKLRYMIPFHSLEKIEAYLEEIRAAGGAAILGDDGEKFGVWPGTKKWVYDEGWLEKFLAFVEERGIRMMTGAECLDAEPPAGRVYLPPASYEEMMEWVLEPDEARAYEDLRARVPAECRRFVRGGFFRDFFRKYGEANHLHKRMLMVSREVREAGGAAAARREVYQGQCNDPYWHGVFGGLYLPHLREAVYHHLLEAEKRTPAAEGWTRLDYDLDGRTEFFRRGETFNLLVKPSFGGALVELDYVPWSRNLSDVLGRRPESYHSPRSQEGGEEGKSIHQISKKLPPRAEDLIRYDWHPRHSLLDHFLRADASEDDFLKVDGGEQGDFVNQPYEAAVRDGGLVLERRGGVWADGERLPVLVRKRIEPRPGLLRIVYEIRNLSSKPLAVRFGSEWNFLAFPHEFERRHDGVFLYGGRLALEPCGTDGLWTRPLETISQSEGGFDIIHQGFGVMPVWLFTISGQKAQRLEILFKETHAG